MKKQDVDMMERLQRLAVEQVKSNPAGTASDVIVETVCNLGSKLATVRALAGRNYGAEVEVALHSWTSKLKEDLPKSLDDNSEILHPSMVQIIDGFIQLVHALDRTYSEEVKS